MALHKNFINGEWVAGSDAKENINPSDVTDVVGEYAQADKGQAEGAIAAAQAAAPAWAATTPQQRADILETAGIELLARKDEIGRLLSREEGKPLANGIAETMRAAQIFKFYAQEALRIEGVSVASVRAGVDVAITREPLGVVGLITPWNFPIAIPAWKMAPALVSGNSVVIKPASQAPALTQELAKALDEAGLPKGVLNVLVGEGREIGTELAVNPTVAAVSFTGSHTVGQQVYLKLAERMARAQMEMGGKNPTIVLADADLDLAATLVVKAGFGLTGQACTATSRVIVEATVEEAF